MKTVVVTIEGGFVKHVEVPKGVRVVVHDYDVFDDTQEGVDFDEYGCPRFVSVWE